MMMRWMVEDERRKEREMREMNRLIEMRLMMVEYEMMVDDDGG